jgi:hypothetical protein
MSPEGLMFIPDIILAIAALFSLSKAARFESAATAWVKTKVATAATKERNELRQREETWISTVGTLLVKDRGLPSRQREHGLIPARGTGYDEEQSSAPALAKKAV